MKSIYYDSKNGEFEEGVIWEASWVDWQDIVARNLVYAKIAKVHEAVSVRSCYRGKEHEEDLNVRAIDVELFGRTLAHIVDVVDHGFSMLTEDFAKRLTASGMTGLCGEKRRENLRKSEWCSGPEITSIRGEGKGWLWSSVQGSRRAQPVSEVQALPGHLRVLRQDL